MPSLRTRPLFIVMAMAVAILAVAGGVFQYIRSLRVTPGIGAILNPTPPPVTAPDKNGYFAWIGVQGPDGIAPVRWGQLWFAEALAADQTIDSLVATDGFSTLIVGPLKIEKAKRPDLAQDVPCAVIEGCLARVALSPATAARALQQENQLLARGDDVIDADLPYQPASRPDYSLYSRHLTGPLSWSSLTATRFAWQASQDRDQEGLERLSREMLFYRMQMQKLDTQTEKQAAIARLEIAYQLLAQYMQAKPDQARQHAALLRTMLEPLSQEITGLTSILHSQLRATVHSLTMATSEPPATSRQVTEKLCFSAWRPFMEAETQQGEAYRRMLISSPETTTSCTPFTSSLINTFLLRDDLLITREILALKLALLEQNVDDQATITTTIAQTRLAHPLTGEAPRFDLHGRVLEYAASKHRNNQPLRITF